MTEDSAARKDVKPLYRDDDAIIIHSSDSEPEDEMSSVVSSTQITHNSDSDSLSEEEIRTLVLKKEDEEKFFQLRNRARNTIYHFLPTMNMEFYNNGLEPLFINFKEYLQSIKDKSAREYIWVNMIQWLLAIKQSPFEEGLLDLKYDDEYYLSLTDFMAEYVHYMCVMFTERQCKDDKVRNGILAVLEVFFENKTSYIQKTLLKIDLKNYTYNAHYVKLIDPIFKKYFSNKDLNQRNDFHVYAFLILCYKKWKTFNHLKEEKEKINEIAMGRYFLDEDPVGVLPKEIPETNSTNKIFASVLPELENARNLEAEHGKNAGSRALLREEVSDSDLDKRIKTYFQIYKKWMKTCSLSSLENEENEKIWNMVSTCRKQRSFIIFLQEEKEKPTKNKKG